MDDLNEVLDRANRILTEWQGSGYYPYAKISELLKSVQSLQND